MEIRLAREMGFCFGVEKAIKIMEDASTSRPSIKALGSIVHNPQVVDKLSAKGINIVDDLRTVEHGTVAITAHGAGPQVAQMARDQGLELIDTTCPLVTRVHVLVDKLVKDGFRVIVYGDAYHPEVKGILGWSNGNGFSANNLAEVHSKFADKPLGRYKRKVAIVSQTTQNLDAFKQFATEVTNAYFGHMSEFRVIDTICNPTFDRQLAAQELAEEVDMMIVIGGLKSANTRHLAQLCNDKGCEAHQIERAEELDEAWFAGKEVIGVTAGASTPDYVIREVVEALRMLGKAEL